eukprot:TRINITY_DN12975_c0_g1_i1.p1 TRINITY_DN12975_c0_g1~~TRINITY_DN12975_c0_g1_i1.p1  ORF type:complete len:311 (-),score=42.16 TRINITY_DN12975_c0_g1_i1:100-1032(-)
MSDLMEIDSLNPTNYSDAFYSEERFEASLDFDDRREDSCSAGKRYRYNDGTWSPSNEVIPGIMNLDIDSHNWESLPSDVWSLILIIMPSREKRSFALVSRWARRVIETNYWAKRSIIKFCRANDEFLKSLCLQTCAASNLRRLDLLFCDRITDQGVNYISTITSLRELSLHGCSMITDRSLESLRSLHNLVSLDLSWCSLITNDGLAHLRTDLLCKLNLSYCFGITDAGIQILAGKWRCALKELRLDQCALQFRTLGGFFLMKDLEILSVMNCPMTLYVSRILRREIPSLKQILLSRLVDTTTEPSSYSS